MDSLKEQSPIWILYRSVSYSYMIPIWISIWILYGSYLDPTFIPIGSLYGSYIDPMDHYMDPLMDSIWILYGHNSHGTQVSRRLWGGGVSQVLGVCPPRHTWWQISVLIGSALSYLCLLSQLNPKRISHTFPSTWKRKPQTRLPWKKGAVCSTMHCSC